MRRSYEEEPLPRCGKCPVETARKMTGKSRVSPTQAKSIEFQCLRCYAREWTTRKLSILCHEAAFGAIPTTGKLLL